LHVAEGAEFFDRHFTDERGCEVDDNICTHNVS
jgi:sialic acid synthase SpsE